MASKESISEIPQWVKIAVVIFWIGFAAAVYARSVISNPDQQSRAQKVPIAKPERVKDGDPEKTKEQSLKEETQKEQHLEDVLFDKKGRVITEADLPDSTFDIEPSGIKLPITKKDKKEKPSLIHRMVGPKAEAFLMYVYGTPEQIEPVTQDFLYAGRRFAYQVEISGLDPSKSHTLITRCYWENHKDEWIRWIDPVDVPETIPAGQTAYKNAWIPNVLGIPGFSIGRNKIEVWVDGKLLTTRYYETKLNPNAPRPKEEYPVRPIE